MSRALRCVLSPLAFALAAAIPYAAPVSGQDPEMESALQTFLTAWQDQDGSRLESALQSSGVTLRMGPESHGPVQPRQAAAALRQYMEDRSPGEFRIRRMSSAGGEPERGFAEVEWSTVVRGTTEPVGYTVFVGMERSDRGWAVQEVRILD